MVTFCRLHEHGLDRRPAVHDVDAGHGAIQLGVRVLRRERVQLARKLGEEVAPEHAEEAALGLAGSLRQQDLPVGTRTNWRAETPLAWRFASMLVGGTRRGSIASPVTRPARRFLTAKLSFEVRGSAARRFQFDRAVEGALDAALRAPLERQLT